MLRPITLFVIFGALICSACTKNSNTQASILYGTWRKGINPGDSIFFLRENGKDICRYPVYYSATGATYTTSMYKYAGKQLYFYLTGGETMQLQTFKWKEEGRIFELQGNDLYPFMSSIAPRDLYTKVRD